MQNKNLQSFASPRPDQVFHAKSILLQAERGAGCTAGCRRVPEALKAKRLAWRRTGNTDDGPRRS